ncbi:APC family permease [Sulfolobus sp. E11-6]|uniref:APC family permease n=1 Tax=Sulfolobus sp. E11-6 TaxID=2663020 RepID=UPI001295A860|nr:APC family permease [Sulfolobus sp. E11-6]QGA67981.1 amino acid permease [Sulfolobus sp. E11-6]
MSTSSLSKAQQSQEPKRHLGFIDIVFLSMGSQAPFLSILTYGVEAFIIAGFLAPIAIILGTLLVLLNGFVVYELSKRFTKAGGYYTYAFYSLTKRLGFETGWLYVLYSTTYGVAYIFGTTYIIYHVLGVNPWIVGLGLLSVASLFAIMGIKISTKYAILTSLLEISIMTILAIVFLSSTGYHLYNPLSFHVSLGTLAYAILFGSSIPTGYGAITPVSGEAKDAKKTISRAIITVILLGGLLAAFDIYAIGDHLLFYKISASRADILHLIENRFGLITFIFVLFAAINDGILGSLGFIIATSRTIFAMSYTNLLPKVFSKFESYKGPTNAVILSVILYFMTSLFGLYFINNPFVAFGVLGTIALFSSLFVHVAANFSLIKISIKKFRKRLFQIIIGIAAVIFSVFELVNSISSASPIEVYIFMSFIIIGFLTAETLSMIEEENEQEE